jgi:hypothetical protein
MSVPGNEVGTLYVSIIGITGASDTFSKVLLVRYKTVSSVVTVGSIADQMSQVIDAGISSASATVDASGTTLRIRVTGQTSLPITWKAQFIINRIQWTG